eukprot:m51a1_g14702 hypothetical protein (384) ;mRNA; f:127416-128567
MHPHELHAPACTPEPLAKRARPEEPPFSRILRAWHAGQTQHAADLCRNELHDRCTPSTAPAAGFAAADAATIAVCTLVTRALCLEHPDALTPQERSPACLQKALEFAFAATSRDPLAAARVVVERCEGAPSVEERSAACMAMGLAHYIGVMVPEDRAAAIEYAARSFKATEFGPAAYSLATVLHRGEVVGMDIDRSAVLYRVAAEKGFAEAQVNLAVLYENGDGVPRDLAEAVRLYEMAALRGSVDAQYYMARKYDTADGVPEDKGRAARLYKLAAEQGDTGSLFSLGCLMHRGAGVAKDRKEALRLWILAAEQGYRPAMMRLGAAYSTGDAVQQDMREAARLWRLSQDSRIDSLVATSSDSVEYVLEIVEDDGSQSDDPEFQ